jgi:hypothetical protein
MVAARWTAPSPPFRRRPATLNLPGTPRKLPPPRVAWIRPSFTRFPRRRGGRRRAPPSSPARPSNAPSNQQKQARVSPRPFSPTFPARSTAGLAGFRRGCPRDPIASFPFFLGSFSWTRDISVNSWEVPGTPVQKWISNRIVVLQNLVKFVENRRKKQKNANSILLDSLWRILQHLLFLPELVPDRFYMKNRNVENLDLQYLKIHKPSVSYFWICSVLCHD